MTWILAFWLGLGLGILLESVARSLDEARCPDPDPDPQPQTQQPRRMERCGCGVVTIDGQPTLRYLMAPESEWPREMLN